MLEEILACYKESILVGRWKSGSSYRINAEDARGTNNDADSRYNSDVLNRGFLK